VKSNQRPGINAGIFLDHVRTVFFTYLLALRSLAAFSQEISFAFIDNSSAPVADDVIRLLTEAGVRIMTFVSHTT
jgi:hypothetical protein